MYLEELHEHVFSERIRIIARQEVSWAINAFRKFFEDRCPSLAASIAFYSAFSLAPTVVIIIAIAGWFFGAETARSTLYYEIYRILGNKAAVGITTIVEHAYYNGNAGSVAAVISFCLVTIGASSTFSSVSAALNIIWPMTEQHASPVLALVRVRLISFCLVLGVAFLLIFSLILDIAITFFDRWLWGSSPYVIIGNILQLGIGFFVLAVACAALLKFLPTATVKWYDAIVGGTIAAALFSIGKKLFALYLAHVGMVNAFGTAGSLAALLMWLYFSAAVLLLGGEFAAARARLHDLRSAQNLSIYESVDEQNIGKPKHSTH